ncbi:unnamed protein product [Dicrocoelium dendriticum]|nr:unnamed protein product [Dicrocoelium dendriticum]
MLGINKFVPRSKRSMLNRIRRLVCTIFPGSCTRIYRAFCSNCLSSLHNVKPVFFRKLLRASFQDIVIKPYTRWGSYAIGLFFGWLLAARPRPLAILTCRAHRTVVLIALASASVFCLSTVYGLYGVTSGRQAALPTWLAALYTAVHRPVFTLGVAIVVYLCATGHAREFMRLATTCYLFDLLPTQHKNRALRNP